MDLNAGARPTHQTIDAKLERILDLLGAENDEGTGGTGLIGRIARIEHRVSVYDRWQQRIVGAMATLTLTGAILWWAWQERLAAVLK